jgi:FkbM family methyltransferase
MLAVPITGGGCEDDICYVDYNCRRYFGYQSNLIESLYYSKNKKYIESKFPYITMNNIGTVFNFAKRFYFPLNSPSELNKASYPNTLDGAIFEIGAFLGFHAAHLAHKYNTSSIFAFEASAKNFYIAAKTLDQYNNAELFNLAVSSKAGRYFFSRDSQQLGSLIPDSFGVDGSGEYVECVKLDDFCLERNTGKVALIRIQVNGSEREVIEGAWNIVVQDLPILIITSKYIEKSETKELLDSLSELGYTFQKFGGTFVFNCKRNN